jgi:predicted dehydrogenase
MEFAFYSPDRRVTLSFPSPFLRSMPTILIREDGKAHSPESTVTQQVVAYAESFKEELIHFHDCVTNGKKPVTSAEDALHDIALCEAVVAVHQSRTQLVHPSEPAIATTIKQRS